MASVVPALRAEFTPSPPRFDDLHQRAGVTQITLQFNLSRALDAAAQDVQAPFAAAARNLPPNLPTPPTIKK